MEQNPNQPLARIPYQACPLCGCQDATLIATVPCTSHALYQPGLPPTIRWVRCHSCTHVFTDGYFGAQALGLLLRGAHPGQLPGAELIGARAISARILDTVTLRLDPADASRPGRWLDVGFGNGALLTTAKEYGYEAIGVDLRETAVRLLRESGVPFPVHHADFLNYRPEAPFQVISLCDVLEHMPFPKDALVHAQHLLTPDGLLFLSMPNIESFLFAHLDRTAQNPYWSEIEHYHNFGRSRLYDLLKQLGFIPIHYGISHRYLACMEVIARRS